MIDCDFVDAYTAMIQSATSYDTLRELVVNQKLNLYHLVADVPSLRISNCEGRAQLEFRASPSKDGEYRKYRVQTEKGFERTVPIMPYSGWVMLFPEEAAEIAARQVGRFRGGFTYDTKTKAFGETTFVYFLSGPPTYGRFFANPSAAEYRAFALNGRSVAFKLTSGMSAAITSFERCSFATTDVLRLARDEDIPEPPTWARPDFQAFQTLRHDSRRAPILGAAFAVVAAYRDQVLDARGNVSAPLVGALIEREAMRFWQDGVPHLEPKTVNDLLREYLVAVDL